MLKTEIALYVKRTKIELANIQRKLDLLETMVEDDILEDCSGVGLDIIFAVENDCKKVGSLASEAWLNLHNTTVKKEAENNESVSA